MSYLVSLGISIACTIVGCLVGGYIASLLMVAMDAVNSTSARAWLSVPFDALEVQAYAMLFALPLSLLLLAPVHAWFIRARADTYMTALALPLLLALAAGLMHPFAGMLAGVYGAAIAIVAHSVRRVFQRTPHSSPPETGGNLR